MLIIERAKRYLNRLPPAIQGQRGSDTLFRAACVLVQGFARGGREAEELLHREYNPRCLPPWSVKEIAHKVADALRVPVRNSRRFLLDERNVPPNDNGIAATLAQFTRGSLWHYRQLAQLRGIGRAAIEWANA